VLGLLGIISAAISQLIFSTKSTIATPLRFQLGVLLFMLLTIYTYAYLRLPQKSGYWVVVIPFVLLFLRVWLAEILYLFCCICLLSASFLFSFGLTDSYRGSTYSPLAMVTRAGNQSIFLDPITGPLNADFTKRKNKAAFCKEVVLQLQANPSNKEKAILICGWWYNELLVKNRTEHLGIEGNLRFYIKKPEIDSLLRQGNTLYFLPEQDNFNDLYSGFEKGYTLQRAKAFVE
jgi:hypothetical protein